MFLFVFLLCCFFVFLVPVVVMLPPWVFSFFQLQLLYFSSSSFCSSCSSSSSEISVKKSGALTKCRRRRHRKFCILSPFFPQEYIVYSPSQIYHILSKKCLTLFEVYAIIHTSTRESSRKEVKLWQLRKHFVTESAPSIPKH